MINKFSNRSFVELGVAKTTSYVMSWNHGVDHVKLLDRLLDFLAQNPKHLKHFELRYHFYNGKRYPFVIGSLFPFFYFMTNFENLNAVSDLIDRKALEPIDGMELPEDEDDLNEQRGCDMADNVSNLVPIFPIFFVINGTRTEYDKLLNENTYYRVGFFHKDIKFNGISSVVYHLAKYKPVTEKNIDTILMISNVAEVDYLLNIAIKEDFLTFKKRNIIQGIDSLLCFN